MSKSFDFGISDRSEASQAFGWRSAVKDYRTFANRVCNSQGDGCRPGTRCDQLPVKNPVLCRSSRRGIIPRVKTFPQSGRCWPGSAESAGFRSHVQVFFGRFSRSDRSALPLFIAVDMNHTSHC